MEENKNQIYKIVKTNEETNICIIRDKYLNYGLSDKDLNIILPAEYMNIQFCKDGDTNILLTKKDKNGIPKYGIANKEGKIIIEPIYGSIKYNKTKDKYVLVSDTFKPDEKISVDINTGLTQNSNTNKNNENNSISFENIKQKSDYEKFLDDTIEQAKDKAYSEFLIGEMTKIKEVVIEKRHYKGWEKEKISAAIASRFSLGTFLVKERDGWNDEWTNRLWNIVEGAANYEQLPDKSENADADIIKQGIQTGEIGILSAPVSGISEDINNEYYNKGVEYINAKDYKNAYQCFEQALDIEPNNEYYKVLQLQCKYEYIQNQDSIDKEFLEVFIEECYNFLGNSGGNYKISVYFWRGVVLYLLGEYDDAEKDFERVVHIEQNAQAFYYLGRIYLDKSRYNKALEYYDKAIEIDPKNIKSYRMRGKTKFYINLPIEESLKDCYKAYELNNNYSFAIENIILYLLLSNDSYKTLHYCDELIEKDAGRVEEAYLLKSIIEFRLNNIDAALMNFKLGYEWYNDMVDYYKRILDDLTNHAQIVEEKFYINEKIKIMSSLLNILQSLNQELQKTVKICNFCKKLEDKNRFIINKGDVCICNECLVLCNEMLEEDCINTNYKVIQHSENSNGDIICSFCGRTNEEVDKIIQADNYYVCNGCVGVLNKVYKNKSDFAAEYKKAIEEMQEDHGSFYSPDDKADSNYLKDKVLHMYGKELAYKYLVRAAHILKRHNCNKKDRQKIVKYLHRCSEYYVNSAVNADFKFDKPEMERLLTVGMEVAFHRIVVMYKNNILNNPTYAENIIDTFASMVCAVEMNYIKDKDRLKDEYHIAITIYFNELKNELKEWLKDGKITKEQYNHALDKSGLEYLAPEITRLMKLSSFKFSKMAYMILFIVIWIIFKLIIFYSKYH